MEHYNFYGEKYFQFFFSFSILGLIRIRIRLIRIHITDIHPWKQPNLFGYTFLIIKKKKSVSDYLVLFFFRFYHSNLTGILMSNGESLGRPSETYLTGVPANKQA